MYYGMAAFFVCFELYALINAKKIIMESMNAQRVLEDIDRTGRWDGRGIDPHYLRAYMVDFFYVVWSAVGLLSSQWVYFAGLFALTLVTSLLRSRTLKECTVTENVKFDRVNSCLSIVLLVTIIQFSSEKKFSND